MSELDSPFFYPYTGKSCCFYCKKDYNKDLFIDLHKKAKAKKDYVICLDHTKDRSEHYLKLINKEGREDIIKVVEETRNKMVKLRAKVEEKLNKIEGFDGYKKVLEKVVEKQEQEREQEKEPEEEIQPEKETPEDRECGAYFDDVHVHKEEQKPPIIDYSDVIEDDEKYWKENYTDTPNECHYCKDSFEYIAKKEDKEVRFCRKHYHEKVEVAGINSEFKDYIFKWVGNKVK